MEIFEIPDLLLIVIIGKSSCLKCKLRVNRAESAVGETKTNAKKIVAGNLEPMNTIGFSNYFR